jgi:hypothetical protein
MSDGIKFTFAGECDKDLELLTWFVDAKLVLELTFAHHVPIPGAEGLVPHYTKDATITVTLLDTTVSAGGLVLRFALLTEDAEPTDVEFTLRYDDIDTLHVC